MSNTDRDLIAELADVLTTQSYSPVVVRNYCAYARGFLGFLAQHEIPVTAVTPSLVAQYLRHAAVTFRKRRGRPPSPHWHSIPRSGIHALLRLALGQWPREPDVIGAEATLRHTIFCNYRDLAPERAGARNREHRRTDVGGAALSGLAARPWRS